jgi:allophanate hydrolase subunit 1
MNSEATLARVAAQLDIVAERLAEVRDDIKGLRTVVAEIDRRGWDHNHRLVVVEAAEAERVATRKKVRATAIAVVVVAVVGFVGKAVAAALGIG